MSSVLEALRKSEQERLMASGQTTSMLYPVMVEQKRGRKWPLPLAAAAVVAAALALTWWLGWRSPRPAIPVSAEKTIVASAPSRAAQTEPVAIRVQRPETTVPPVATAKPVRKPVAKKSEVPVSATAPVLQPDPAMTDKAETGAEPLPKDLPVLNIAGYIRDEQGASLAMINDKLVREGEEVAPGVRLEKILGDGSIFSYKGQRFRR